MNAKRLLAHYEQIADAPDAIGRLRRFILDLAVRGKLVPQDPRDEPAAELLKRIAKEKARIDRKERIRRESRNIIGATEMIDIPTGWAIAPLSDLVTILNGRAYKQNELLNAGTPVLRVGNLFTSDKWYYSDLHLDNDKYCGKGDLIFAWSASFGPFIWQGERVIYHYHIWKLPLHSEADLDKLYLYNFLLQKTREIKEAGHGMSMIHMTKEKMELIQVPLPPLAEQKRIVAKVDELMALCDQLEAAQAKREATRDRLAASSLACLNAPDPQTFQDDVRFVLNALPALTTRPDQIKPLRQTILNLAVHGKLAPQDPNDEPASELLKRIERARTRPVASRKAKRPNEPEDITKSDINSAVPTGWAATRLGIVYDVRDGTHDTPRYVEDGYPLITSKNLSSGYLSFEQVRFISERDHLQISERSKVEKGDILLAMIGSIGNPVIVETERPFSIKNVALFKYFDKALVSPGFLRYFLQYASNEMRNLAAGGLQPFVSLAFLRNFPLSLPPLAEQRRIVAKVNELMVLCDQLEASLTTCNDTRRRLLDALLHEALTPEMALEEAA